MGQVGPHGRQLAAPAHVARLDLPAGWAHRRRLATVHVSPDVRDTYLSLAISSSYEFTTALCSSLAAETCSRKPAFSRVKSSILALACDSSSCDARAPDSS
ncbi:Uncharacterized protein PBTT_04274 [Plasmodiophora brassicae]